MISVSLIMTTFCATLFGQILVAEKMPQMAGEAASEEEAKGI